jgi:ribonuclease BN (tRNA processing enzyme)
MRLITLGTGTVVPDPERASACHWIEAGATSLLVDCGAGAIQSLARAGLAWGSLEHLLISHFHADHIGAIPSLVFALRHGLEAPREKPLDVWGPIGTRRLFQAWSRAVGVWLVRPGFPVRFHEIEPGEPSWIGDLRVSAIDTPHTDESLGFRFESECTALGYTGDTGPSDDLAHFFDAVDLLLAECSLPDDSEVDIHLTPSSLAHLASAAGAGRLAVTHVYPQLRVLDVPLLIGRAGYEGEVIMAHDGLELIVEGEV